MSERYVLGLDFGHLPPAPPLINGAVATVERTGNRLQLRYEFR